MPTINGPRYGAPAVVHHYLLAPIFMTKVQPLGTLATEAVWPRPDRPARPTSPLWPGFLPLLNLAKDKVAQGLVLDFKQVQDWFLPRYTAWQANSTAAITQQDMLAAVAGMWVPKL